MYERIPRAVVLKYYFYQLAQSAQLAGPVWVLFLTSRGMSYTQVGVLDSAFAAVVILAELPTGYLGDRIGRRNGLLVATGVRVIGSIGFAVSGSFGLFLLLYSLLAIGRTFRSGTEDAWLYDILTERIDSDEFARIRGRGQSLGMVMGGVGAVAGGALGGINLALPWVASAVMTAVAFGVLLTFPKTQQYADDDSDPLGPVRAASIARNQLGGSLLVFVLYTGLLFSSTAALNYMIQPVAINSGISIEQIGWLYAGFQLVSAVVNYFTGWIEEAVGGVRWFQAIPVVLGGTFAAVIPFGALAIPAFFLLEGIRTTSVTIEQQYINDRVVETGRATVLSTVAMIQSVITIPFQVGIGRTADAVGPRTAAGVFGVLLIAGSIAGLLLANLFNDGIGTDVNTTVTPATGDD